MRTPKQGEAGLDYSYPIRVAADKYPNDVAVLYRDERITYAELDRRIDRLASELLARGLSGARVSTIMLNRPATLCVYLALSRIGAVNVPVNVRLTTGEQEYIVRDAGATAIVVAGEYTESAEQLREAVPELERVFVAGEGVDSPEGVERIADLLAAGSDEEVRHDVDGASAATIMYTSGTTGFPKGVVRTHDANLWNVANSALGSPRSRDDVEFFTLPIFGIGFMHFAMPAFLAGATVLLDDAFDPERTWTRLSEHRATRVFLAPTMIDSMLSVADHESYDVSALEVIYAAYEFPDALRERALARFGDRFVYMYGLTEAQLTAARPGEFAGDPTSAGKAMGLMRIRILDDAGRALPQGETGEIALEGPALMAGYHELPDATAESLRDGWVRTGDLGYLDADRNLHFAGRKKEIIKTGGFSVDPREVENVLLAAAGIREAAVVGVPDSHWGEMVVAFVAPLEPDVTEAGLREICRERLADYKVPKRMVFMDELPKNPTGKIERGRLRDRWSGLQEA